MNKKWLIVGILSLLLVISGSLFYFTDVFAKDANESSIDDILERTVSIDQITTNLASDDYIRISFTIQVESKKAKEELEKRDFQVKNLMIQELSEMQADDLRGKDGQLLLQKNLTKKINDLMESGKIEKIYITESILQ
ncbi:flagellar basal body-associated protein FliL [Cytobacillus sp. FSL W7-1323]|uniref:Flagellar protein FliL n=1 Tax=Cytobacillus kochii TaxID=859143 RepID=A0A248TCH8_9BACI|nr:MULTISPECIES: flagellar basal body-associated protein FliL [Cytobacillus]ASV65948.1 flagellar basal body-associated protein FliL [Cytobacillus kochii]MCA1028476.1 flagellar basal body-associated protein FliL [Cytobacillus kochii]MCM3321702.1 flagellar basal body-associated protein FliL [Cytobacillus kochii]MCM3343464.1 flagellar basal body-associated protein FliL [Cytobacillus kochii]MDQ0184818.1 flagellar FliL protein [Cytobacillus kochii]